MPAVHGGSVGAGVGAGGSGVGGKVIGAAVGSSVGVGVGGEQHDWPTSQNEQEPTVALSVRFLQKKMFSSSLLQFMSLLQSDLHRGLPLPKIVHW